MKKKSRFGTVISASYLELLGGGAYAFAVYAPRIKSQFALTQGQVQFIGTVGNVGSWLLLPAGFSFDRYGPKLGIALGMVLTFGGYLYLWSILRGRTLSSVSSLAFAAFVAQHGSSWWDGTAVPMASRNFPQNRGLVVGLLKGLFGISSSVITVMYQSFFRPDIAGFICFLAISLPAGAFFTLFGAHVSDKQAEDLALALKPEEKSRLYHEGYGLLSLLVVYITFGSLYQKIESHKAIGIVLLFILCSFCLLLLPLEIKAGTLCVEEGENERDHKTEHHHGGSAEHEEFQMDVSAPARNIGYGPILRQRSFWVLFGIMMIGMGTGITLINHVGDLVLSLDGKEGTQDSYVAIISVGSCLGRASAGILSDKYRHRLRRTTFIVLSTSIMMVGQLSLCASDLGLLYLSCAICGCSFGAFFSLLPTTLSDLYGQADFGKVLGTAMFAPGCGSLFFSTFLASTLYKRQTSEDSLHHECKGASCYRGTFFIFFLVNLFGTGLAIRLRRMTKLYFPPHSR